MERSEGSGSSPMESKGKILGQEITFRAMDRPQGGMFSLVGAYRDHDPVLDDAVFFELMRKLKKEKVLNSNRCITGESGSRIDH